MPTAVTLESIALRHAPAVQRLAAHPDVVATTNLPDPYPEDGARTWIETVVPRQEAGEAYAFAILNAEDVLVGVTGFVDVTATVAELGYWIGRPYWNCGYATAANRQVLAFAFGPLALARVVARPLARNAPSRRVLEKLGFAFLRTEPPTHPKWSEEDVMARYEMSRSQWKEVVASLRLMEHGEGGRAGEGMQGDEQHRQA